MAWCKLPSRWVKDHELQRLTWSTHGSDGTAALLLLMAIAVHINQATIAALREAPGQPPPIQHDIQLTYDELADTTGVSRPKVSSGLKVLKALGLITATKTGRTMRYTLPQILTPGDWCPFPQTWVYRHQILEPFQGFQLREKWELHALKLYLVLLTFKSNGRPRCQISYTAIERYTGVEQAVVSPTAISITAGRAWCSCRGRTAHTD